MHCKTKIKNSKRFKTQNQNLELPKPQEQITHYKKNKQTNKQKENYETIYNTIP